MEYHKKADLKVECIATQEDFDFLGLRWMMCLTGRRPECIF